MPLLPPRPTDTPPNLTCGLETSVCLQRFQVFPEHIGAEWCVRVRAHLFCVCVCEYWVWGHTCEQGYSWWCSGSRSSSGPFQGGGEGTLQRSHYWGTHWRGDNAVVGATAIWGLFPFCSGFLLHLWVLEGPPHLRSGWVWCRISVALGGSLGAGASP